MKKKKYRKFQVDVKEVNKENFTLEAVFSTENQDRHREVVKQNFDLKQFKANPVLLNSHNYDDATEVIGKIQPIAVKDGKLQGKIKFAVSENPKAKIIFDLYAGGFLNAFSIGFIPLEFNEKDSFIIDKSELLEVSAVSVPANAYALAKSKGINVEELGEENLEKCKHEKYEKTDKGFKCVECGECEETEKKEEEEEKKEEDEEIEEEKVEEEKEMTKAEKQMEALKIIAEQKKKRERYILTEILAVTRQLQRDKVDINRKRQMVNRAIRQFKKLK